MTESQFLDYLQHPATRTLAEQLSAAFALRARRELIPIVAPVDNARRTAR